MFHSMTAVDVEDVSRALHKVLAHYCGSRAADEQKTVLDGAADKRSEFAKEVG